jgi:lipid A 3-O-deacylase
MKKILITFVALILFSGLAVAEEQTGYGVSFGYGMTALDSVDIYRIGLKKDFKAKWFEKESGYLSGYFELSYNRWEHESNDINAFALSPVFAYYFINADKYVTPYIEFGIGGA